jgi:hypothetical protein
MLTGSPVSCARSSTTAASLSTPDENFCTNQLCSLAGIYRGKQADGGECAANVWCC